MADALTPQPGMQIVAPYLQQRNRNAPVVGGHLTVNLQGNIIRAQIERVYDHDLAQVRIETVPMGNNPNNFQKGDLINVRRHIGDHDIEGWVVVTQRDLDQAARERELEEARKTEAEEARRKEIEEIRARDLAKIAAEEKKTARPARKPKAAAQPRKRRVAASKK